MRVVVVAASSFLLVAAGVLAVTQSRTDSLFTVDQVTESFARHGFALAEPAPELGWGDPAGAILLTRPIRRARFLVLVARREAIAEDYFAELTRGGPTSDAFDVLRGNVVVTSDSSFTQNGLALEERARLRAAMDALGGGPS